MSEFSSGAVASPRGRAALWGMAFSVVMIGTGLLARYFDLSDTATMIALLPPMLLLIPMIRSAEAAQAGNGYASVALRTYNQRMIVASFGYMLGLFCAIALWKNGVVSGLLVWPLAIVPSLGVLAMIRAMARYLIEEQDEYLQHRTVKAVLFGLGLLLALATIWGFLEMFGLVPHAPGWLAVPVWAIGMGIGQFAFRSRGA